MNPEDDKLWDEVAGKLRKVKGLCPLTPEEAEAGFDAAPEIPLSEEQVRAIVESVTSGELTSWEPVPGENGEHDPAVEEVGAQAGQMFRNKGDEDGETDLAEKELEEELLNDDEPEEDEPGLAGGTTPAGGGG